MLPTCALVSTRPTSTTTPHTSVLTPVLHMTQTTIEALPKCPLVAATPMSTSESKQTPITHIAHEQRAQSLVSQRIRAAAADTLQTAKANARKWQQEQSEPSKRRHTHEWWPQPGDRDYPGADSGHPLKHQLVGNTSGGPGGASLPICTLQSATPARAPPTAASVATVPPPARLHPCTLQTNRQCNSTPQSAQCDGETAKQDGSSHPPFALSALATRPERDLFDNMALNPEDPADLETALDGMQTYLNRSFASSTTAQDKGSNWVWWSKWCATWRTSPLRNYHHSFASLKEARTEIFLQAAAVPWILQRMKPGKGRSRPLPSSAAAVIRGVRRLHVARGFELPPLTLVNRMIKGICDEYLELHGPESLEPHRKEPFTADIIRKLLVWYQAFIPTEERKLMLCVATTLLAQSGLRKAEIASIKRVFTRKCMSRASVAWLIDGVLHADPTPQQLARLVPGRDFAVVKPPPSKSDRFGEVWGNLPIYLLYEPDQAINAATWLRKLELEHPTTGDTRSATPLFQLEDGKPPSSSTLDEHLKQALAQVAPDVKHLHSWHSFRIYLACSLKAAGCQDSEIQALCRWQTLESLRIYARLNAEDYAAFLARAQATDISQIQSANIPQASGGNWGIELDASNLCAEMQRFELAEDAAHNHA